MELTTRDKKHLAAKHMENGYQIRRWAPIRYIDNTRETGIAPELDGCHAVITGTLLSCEEKSMNTRRGSYLMFKVREHFSGLPVSIPVFGKTITARYGHYLVGHSVFASGKLSLHPRFGYSLSYETLEEYSDERFRLIPVYSKIRGMSDERRDQVLQEALKEEEGDTVPEKFRQKYGLLGIQDALKEVMTPASVSGLRAGKLRLLFDDLFYAAARFELMERIPEEKAAPVIKTHTVMDQVKSSLPFPLTGDQERAAAEIIQGMSGGAPMHTLVMGDVGCGKTITAFLPAIAAAENGIQVSIVAPTKILAEQHYEKLSKLLADTGITAGLFTGTRAKKADTQALANGEILIAVGTHALLQEGLEFKSLGLVIIDEEQKFGVKQRQALQEKQKGIHSISLSATPIPRTLACAIYGSRTNILEIREKPGGRKPVVTRYFSGEEKDAGIRYILNRGEQIYVVCPAISDGEETGEAPYLTTERAKAVYEEKFPSAKICNVDGKMPKKEQEEAITAFREGEADILIATTVIEVGVDVPNATLMVIENAERFGLSQMHQLRGRVGRGEKQSYCILSSERPIAENERAEVLCRTNDGFEIAKQDLLLLRKSGDLFGETQSGFNAYAEEIALYGRAWQMIQKEVKGLPDEVLQRHVNKMLLCEVKGHKKAILV